MLTLLCIPSLPLLLACLPILLLPFVCCVLFCFGWVQCRKVFEILNFFVDNGIDSTAEYVFKKEELERFASSFRFKAADYDYGYDVRKEASRLLDLPIIGSFEEGGVDVSEVSISFGSLSRFDSDQDLRDLLARNGDGKDGEEATPESKVTKASEHTVISQYSNEGL